MYHSIESVSKKTVMKSLNVPPRRFKFQMFILKLLGYKGLSLRELEPYLKGKMDGKVFGITFDDGYQNNLLNASSILAKYKFSATCYIVTDNIGSFNTWDFAKGITQKPLMNDREIRQWLRLGFDIGAHTKNHVDLTNIDINKSQEEIHDSKIFLEEKFNISIEDFCYPYGSLNEKVVKLVEASGYLRATSMQRGRSSGESNKFLLPRIPINYNTLPYLFLIKFFTHYEDKRK